MDCYVSLRLAVVQWLSNTQVQKLEIFFFLQIRKDMLVVCKTAINTNGNYTTQYQQCYML